MPDPIADFRCECADLNCDRVIPLTGDEYDVLEAMGFVCHPDCTYQADLGYSEVYRTPRAVVYAEPVNA